MIKKKGFTLIELLAVIVILAVIALIVTPIVTGIIKSAKEQADRRSAEGYVKAAENYYASTLLDQTKKDKLGTNIFSELDVSSKTATKGNVVVDTNGNVLVSILIGNKCYSKQYNQNLSEMVVSNDITNCVPKTISETVLKAFPQLELGTSGCKTSTATNYSYMNGCYLANGSAIIGAKDIMLTEIYDFLALTEEEKTQLLDSNGNIIGTKFDEIVVPKFAQLEGVTVEQLNQMAIEQGITVFQMMNEGHLTLEEVNASKSIKGHENYLWYSGFLWRIMGINSDGSIKLITEENVTAIPYNVANNTNFEGSHVDSWLNEYFFNNLRGSNIILSNNFCQGVATTSSTSARTDCTGGTTLNKKVGLISLDEYNLARGTNSYLKNNQLFWTMAQDSSSDAWFVKKDGTASFRLVSGTGGLRPVINVNSNATITGGNGTLSSTLTNESLPYILNENKSTSTTGLLKDKVTSGEYVKLANKTYRVVSVDSKENTKLILNDYYYEADIIADFEYGIDNIFTTTTGIGQKLNTSVLDWLIPASDTTNRNKLVTNYTWYQNNFDYGNSYTVSLNETTPTRSIEATVGLIRVGEMLSGQSYTNAPLTILKYWTITPYNDGYSAWLIYSDGNLYNRSDADFVGGDPKCRLRPVIVVDSSVAVTGGNGTPSSPYEI